MDFDLSRTIGLLKKTMPFLLLRMLIFMGITITYIVVTGGASGIGYGIGSISSEDSAASMAFWGGMMGFGTVSGGLYLIREYILYMVKAGHITVLVHLLNGDDVKPGREQIDLAVSEVKSRFVESSVLFGLDQLIKGVLKAINGMLLTIANWLPIPGIETLANFASTIIKLSLTYVDEVILGYLIHTNAKNPWQGARDGLVLYAQNYKSLVKNAIFLSVIVWAASILLFILVWGPFAALVAFVPGFGGFWSFIVTLIFVYSIKAAVIDPLAMTAMMQVFFNVTEGQEPKQEWVDKIDGLSDKFKEMGKKAASYVMPDSALSTPKE